MRFALGRFEQLDVTAFDRYYSGIEHHRSVELYVKLAGLFLKNFEPKLKELTDALKNKQTHEARVIAHRLKGSLLSLGGNELAKVFFEVEQGLAEEKAQDYASLIHQKQNELQQFLSELSVWMETLEASVKSTS